MCLPHEIDRRAVKISTVVLNIIRHSVNIMMLDSKPQQIAHFFTKKENLVSFRGTEFAFDFYRTDRTFRHL